MGRHARPLARRRTAADALAVRIPALTAATSRSSCGSLRRGAPVWTAAQDEAGLVLAEPDIRRSEAVRRVWPYLRDRRIDGYDDLSLRFCDQ